jgi:hypothetical protein
MAWSSSLYRRLATATQSLNLRNSLTSSLSRPSKVSNFHSLAVNTTKDRLHSVTGCQRLFSTQPATEPATAEATGPSFTKPTIIQGKDGRQFAVFDTQKHPKLKPSIVRRRLNRMRIFDGAEKNIRHSPWRLNLVCQLVAGLPFQEAMTQLDFCKKSKAPLVQKMLQRTANLADIRHGLQPSQLEVAECFATRGTPLRSGLQVAHLPGSVGESKEKVVYAAAACGEGLDAGQSGAGRDSSFGKSDQGCCEKGIGIVS